MVATVHVGVALTRPPKVDELRRIIVEADTETDAKLLACQIAMCTCVMPVSAEIVEITDL